MFRPALLRDFRKCRRAASAVEFAIVAPIFILVLVGIAVYGLYFGTALGITQIAAEAARASVAGIGPQERSDLAVQRANALISSYGFLRPDRMTVVAHASVANPALFQVEVTYDASDLPIYAFSDLVPVPSRTIHRTSTIQRGGF